MYRPLRSLVRLRQLGRRHPLLVDTVLAVASAAVSLALGRQEPPAGWHWHGFDALAVALTCLMNGTLAARRRAPVVVLLAYSGLWIGYVVAGYWPVVNAAGAMMALYTLAASRPLRLAVAGTALLAVCWIWTGVLGPPGSLAAIVAQGVSWPVVLCYFGTGSRRLAERGHQLAERGHQLAERGRQLAELTEQLRRDREELARRAVVDERVRIARELHDVVAHHMSVISVQAGLARYVLESDPPTARTALGTVLGTTGEALDEMRRLLAVLRVDRESTTGSATGEATEPYDPAPDLDHLADLLDRVRQAGVPIELVVTGTRRALPPGVDLCAYRVIQESLTNVLKHAGPARVMLTLHYGTDRFLATVTDDGQGRLGTGPANGHGLIGMAERAKLYGGTVTAGRGPDGGFTVVLALPIAGVAD